MGKKTISILLCLAILVCTSACDTTEIGVIANQPVVVAVGTEESAEYYAALDYTSTNGFDLAKYRARQSAILAVENAKADYVIISDKVATKEFLENTNLQWQENIPFKIEYSAIFNKGDEAFKSTFDDAVKALKEEQVFEKIQEAHFQGEGYAVNENVKTKGRLTVICAPVFDDMLYYDENGDVAGCELYIIKEICNKLNVEAELYVCKSFEEMFTALEKGEGDVIISSVPCNDERKDSYLLSEPYFQTEFGLYKRKY
jgi:ABC-type amino acid transport substrate-binding protein